MNQFEKQLNEKRTGKRYSAKEAVEKARRGQQTPGPWATSRDAVPAGHTQITVYEEKTGKRVATVFETPANATLICAAPELLAFAKWVIRCAKMPAPHGISAYAIADEWMDNARDAVAKAEGRS